jgi:hypothetical protein
MIVVHQEFFSIEFRISFVFSPFQIFSFSKISNSFLKLLSIQIKVFLNCRYSGVGFSLLAQPKSATINFKFSFSSAIIVSSISDLILLVSFQFSSHSN